MMGEPPSCVIVGMTTKIELVFVSDGLKVGGRVGVTGESATIADTTLLELLPITFVTSILNLYWKVYVRPVTVVLKDEEESGSPY